MGGANTLLHLGRCLLSAVWSSVHTGVYSNISFPFFLFCFIYFTETERKGEGECKSGRKTSGKGERENSQADSPLSMKPDVGLISET